MNDSMAIRANWNKISLRIYDVVFAYLMQRSQMVNVNKPIHADAINRGEIKLTDCADWPKQLDAALACNRVTLITID